MPFSFVAGWLMVMVWVIGIMFVIVLVAFVAVVMAVAHRGFDFCFGWVRCRRMSPVLMTGSPLGMLVALNSV